MTSNPDFFIRQHPIRIYLILAVKNKPRNVSKKKHSFFPRSAVEKNNNEHMLE